MDYLIPAWHEQIGNWAYGTPNLAFDDVVSIFKLFGQGRPNPGLVVTDYQPGLSTRLAQSALEPRRLFSVFDYIQGTQEVENRTIDFYDFNWPDNVFFEFTPFHLIVRDGTALFANVFFDLEGKIIYVEYFHNDHHYLTLGLDSRGFVSREETYNEEDNHLTEVKYLDPRGNWRIKTNPDTGSIDVNPTYQEYFQQSHYNNMNELIQEVLQKQFLDKLDANDRLVVTIDNQSNVPQTIYAQYPVIYEASKWRPFDQALSPLAKVPNLKMVCDTQFTVDKVQQLLKPSSVPVEIPLYQAMFKLGHSQQLKEQQIYLFLDNTDLDQLQSITEVVVDYMLAHPFDTELYLLSCGGDGNQKADRILKTLDKRHSKQFHIRGHQYKAEKNNENADAEALNRVFMKRSQKKKKELPLLTISFVQWGSQSDILKGLDKARLLIDWGDHPDDFLQMALLSIGIPVLQRIQTEEVINRQNGQICRDYLDLRDGLRYYLDGLKHWNESLANDVQIMNEHSADKLLAKWDQVWQQGSDQA